MTDMTVLNREACPAMPVAALSHQSAGRGPRRIPMLAYIDEVTLSRECITQCLMEWLFPDVSIAAFASLDAAEAAGVMQFNLALLHHRGNAGIGLTAAVQAIAGTSLPVLVMVDDVSPDFDLMTLGSARAGLCGLVSTSDTDCKLLSAAIRFALDGGTFFPPQLLARRSPAADGPASPARRTGGLTRRQTEVFAKMQQGKPNKLIAYELRMSESTVKVHVRAIMRLIGATNRTQAVFMGQQRLGPSAVSQLCL